MAFWIAIAVLMGAASIALLTPLGRSRSGVADRAAAMAIYRDQLNEIDRDISRGVLADSEAKAARAEIARRLLQREASSEETESASPVGLRVTVAAALVAIPLVSVGVYLWLGAPGEPDRPVAQRLADPSPDDLPALAALVDEALAANPDDAELWQAALQVNAGLGRFDEAGEAYLNLMRLEGEDGDPDGAVGVAIGEAIITAAGAMTETARQVFAAAAAAAPQNPAPRLYLAVALAAEGDTPAAIAAFEALLEDEPEEGSTWADFAREQLAALQGDPDAAAIAALPPDGQLAAITGMVEGLAARLAENPDDPEGWAELIRSYIVLGRTGDAVAARDEARGAFAGDQEALALIDEASGALEQVE